MASPTERSVAYLKKQGYAVWIVEVWNPYTKTRKDLFNMLDIVAIRADLPGVLGVQTTSGSNASARVKKIRENPLHAVWLAGGNRIVVHSWGKRGARGKRKLWTCGETWIERSSQ